jgi:hypothetical protein
MERTWDTAVARYDHQTPARRSPAVAHGSVVWLAWSAVVTAMALPAIANAAVAIAIAPPVEHALELGDQRGHRWYRCAS